MIQYCVVRGLPPLADHLLLEAMGLESGQRFLRLFQTDCEDTSEACSRWKSERGGEGMFRNVHDRQTQTRRLPDTGETRK